MSTLTLHPQPPVIAAAKLARQQGGKLYTNGHETRIMPRREPGWYPIGVVVQDNSAHVAEMLGAAA